MKLFFNVVIDIDKNEVDALGLIEQDLKENFEAGISLALTKEFGAIPTKAMYLGAIED